MRRESHVRFCEGGGVRLPSATRLVRSIKDECLDRMIPLVEWHFRRAVAEYVERYHAKRRISNRLIVGPSVIQKTGRVRRRPRLRASSTFLRMRDRQSAEKWIITRITSSSAVSPSGRQGVQKVTSVRTGGRFIMVASLGQ